MSANSDAGRIRGVDWAIYFGLLTLTFVVTLFVTRSVAGALCATVGAVLAATKAAQMVTRAYRTRVLPPDGGPAS